MKDNMRRRAAELVQRVGPHRVRPRQVARRLFLALAAMTFVGGLTPVLASETAGHPAIGDTAIFASVPAPGHPFGVAVDKDRVYVSTSDGDFYAQHLNTQGERVSSGRYASRRSQWPPWASLASPSTATPHPTTGSTSPT